MLVLYSFFKDWKDAILIDPNGDDKIASCITTGTGTSAFKACSVTWKNNFYIIGGANSDGRSIMKLSGRVISRIGDLEFDHHWASCNNVKDQKLFLSRFSIELPNNFITSILVWIKGVVDKKITPLFKTVSHKAT